LKEELDFFIYSKSKNMKRFFIFMLLSFLGAIGKIAAQTEYVGEEYNIYFHSNETQLLQYRKPKECLLGVVAGNGTTIQLGYSPIPFLSIEAACLTKLVKNRGDYNKRKNAYTFALGTYWFLENKPLNLKENKGETKREPQYGLLLSAKAGYSFNKMQTEVREGGSSINFAETESDFNVLFANLSFGYQYSWGLLTLTGSIQNVEFNKLIFSGTFMEIGKLSDIASQLREQSNYNVFSMGFHNEFGRSNVRLLAGGSFPLIYFQDFKNQAAEIDDPFIYVGVMLNLNRIFSSNLSRKQK
jgi:hypothetical protein